MAVTMSDKVPPLNFLGNKRDKVFLECAGHVYSVPVDDVKNLPLLDTSSKSYYALEGDFAHYEFQRREPKEGHETIKRVASETSCSDVSSASDAVASAAESPSLVRCSASRGLAEAKEETTRLIDQLILEIEQSWSSEKSKDDMPDTENPTFDEVLVEKKVSAVATSNSIHPDGDYNTKSYRIQNLEVLKSKSFRESKSQTRMGLLEKMRTLVETLKDLEKLE